MAEPSWTWSRCETIPSSQETGRALVEEFLAELSKAGWEGREYFHVHMAAEEALVNAVVHGNKDDSSKKIEIELKVCRESAYLRFRDEGEGFSPDDLPDPRDDEHLEVANGRGVLLIREMMSEVRYNDRGNEVEMLKHRELESSSS